MPIYHVHILSAQRSKSAVVGQWDKPTQVWMACPPLTHTAPQVCGLSLSVSSLYPFAFVMQYDSGGTSTYSFIKQLRF